MQKLINDAKHMKKEIVAEKPASGDENTMYLVGPKGDGSNIYEEWLFVNNKWEKIGDTSTTIDLDGYIREEDLISISNEEINQAMGA